MFVNCSSKCIKTITLLIIFSITAGYVFLSCDKSPIQSNKIDHDLILDSILIYTTDSIACSINDTIGFTMAIYPASFYYEYVTTDGEFKVAVDISGNGNYSDTVILRHKNFRTFPLDGVQNTRAVFFLVFNTAGDYSPRFRFLNGGCVTEFVFGRII
ncbi:MAG: hypothetical protein AB1633_10975, partial [Elusimicrobiota bacterium]